MNKTFLTVTIDVEPDCTTDWTYSNPLTFNGVDQGIKDILQPLFNKFGITPTYLINNVVLEDFKSVEIFKNLKGNFELGTHLHPEFIKPFKSVYDYAGSKGVANCCEYEPEVEYDKIKNITKLFISNFGYAPTSFRAGRFSASKNTLKSLSKLGYKIDTSVTPGVCWNDRTRIKPIDFSNYNHKPFWFDEKLLEIPVTILKKENFSINELLKSGFGLLRQPRFFKPQWFRPVFSNTEALLDIVNKVKLRDSEITILNLMFHNVEIMPKLSPYCKSQLDCDNYLKSLETLFSFTNSCRIKSVPISYLHELYKEQK